MAVIEDNFGEQRAWQVSQTDALERCVRALDQTSSRAHGFLWNTDILSSIGVARHHILSRMLGWTILNLQGIVRLREQQML